MEKMVKIKNIGDIYRRKFTSVISVNGKAINIDRDGTAIVEESLWNFLKNTKMWAIVEEKK